MFLEVDEDFIEHPKSVRLCRALQNPLGWAYVIKLWRWCTKFQKDGDLSGYEAGEVEQALGWTLDEGVLFAALVKAGFIDVDGADVGVHDWDKHQGKWIKRLEQDRVAARDRRAGRRRSDTEPEMPALHELAELDKQEELPSIGTTSARHRHDVADSLAKPSNADPIRADQEPPNPQGGDPPGLEEAWRAYPKTPPGRSVKALARARWKKARPDPALFLASLEAWKACAEWRKDGGAFVPSMQKFILQGYWQGPPESGTGPPANGHRTYAAMPDPRTRPRPEEFLRDD